MKVDIISDTICPWCYIGKQRFDRARAERPEIDFDITWRPFQLNPEMPDGGMDRETYLKAKFGGEAGARAAYAPVRQAAEGEGLDLRFDMIARTPNTLDSHRLIRWARGVGQQDAMVTLLFQKYFEEGEDIGDPEVLVAAAGEAGLDPVLVAELLANGTDRDSIEAEDRTARQMGIQGVPAFIFEDRILVTGAQDTSVFLEVFDKIEDLLLQIRAQDDDDIGGEN
ncbi:DsbA family oxidoreductase [Futiania mangrovi]|uniref:DsbA family oxidoreductase n=1 Tax=Futiania mangrovi TaxID=2959716 RepID=A0A9J6PBW8_9PROT|nr:DsbA family oxidoreductase [Futiania mangrovii]MCP1335710.1 DsbA family oxidoreductase [Futiania mangrovii]